MSDEAQSSDFTVPIGKAKVERAIVTNLRQEKAASDIGSAGWAQNQDLLLNGAVLKARRSACM